jgi:hypothetical protein
MTAKVSQLDSRHDDRVGRQANSTMAFQGLQPRTAGDVECRNLALIGQMSSEAIDRSRPPADARLDENRTFNLSAQWRPLGAKHSWRSDAYSGHAVPLYVERCLSYPGHPTMIPPVFFMEG